METFHSIHFYFFFPFFATQMHEYALKIYHILGNNRLNVENGRKGVEPIGPLP